MKLLAENETGLRKAIDSDCDSETSIVLRYRNALQLEEDEERDPEYKKWLERTSIREGARIFPLLIHQGVEIFILDETSLMRTKTLKSIDGCITTARCKLNGYEKVVFESGGNTGTALTQYGTHAGLETFMVLPEANLPLLDSKIFESDKAHLFSVQKPGWVKEAAHRLEKLMGLRHVPEPNWRYEASMFRGLFILEYLLGREKFDWLSQTISAAFGPIGIYRVLGRFEKELKTIPQFLGVQQEANAPLYRAWKGEKGGLPSADIHPIKGLLARVMYDVNPQTYGTFHDLKQILAKTGGTLTTLTHQDFDVFLERPFSGKNILDLLKDHGIDITVHQGEVVEKTGLIAIAGLLKVIDRGEMAKGSKVLCCLTSGISQADGKATPDMNILNLDELNERVHETANEV